VIRLSKFSPQQQQFWRFLALRIPGAEPLARINGQTSRSRVNIIESELGPDVAGLPRRLGAVCFEYA